MEYTCNPGYRKQEQQKSLASQPSPIGELQMRPSQKKEGGWSSGMMLEVVIWPLDIHTCMHPYIHTYEHTQNEVKYHYWELIGTKWIAHGWCVYSDKFWHVHTWETITARLWSYLLPLEAHLCVLLFLCLTSFSLPHKQALFCCILLQGSFHCLEFYITQVISTRFGFGFFQWVQWFWHSSTFFACLYEAGS